MKIKRRREKFVNAFYVHDEVVDEPTCVEEGFYEINDDPDFDYLLRFIMKNRKLLKPIYHDKSGNQEIIIFSTKYPKRIISRIDNEDAIKKCQDIINGTAHRCECCGAVILDKYLFTFRNQN